MRLPSEARIARNARWLPFLVVALVGALSAVTAYHFAADADHARIRAAMELRAEWRVRDFERKLHVLANPVEAMAVLLASEADVGADLFNRFAARSHTAGDPLRRIAWAPKSDGGEHFPVALEHDFAENRTLTGVDVASGSTRLAIIEKARDTARPLSTSVLPLLDSPAVGYAVFWPVYTSGLAPATLAERRAQLRGIVIGTFAINTVLNAAIVGTPRIIESIYFYVGRRPGSGPPDATYSPSAGSIERGGEMAAAPADGAIRITRSFDVFGQKWTLVSDFSPAAFASLRSSSRWAFPAGVLLLTAVLLAYLAREQGRRTEMEKQVAERTAELRAANVALSAEIEARQKTYFQLAQSQKMEAVGNLTGGMAHDFNNLLGIIIGNLDLLCDRQTGDAEAGELAKDALDAAMRGADLTRRLLAFARRQPLQPERTDLNALVANISNLLKRTLGEQIKISVKLDQAAWPVIVDPVQLESSLTNLATNARDAMPKGGRLVFMTGNRHLDADYAGQHAEVVPGDYAMIEVSDSGAGIPAELAGQIFEPFFTTKEQGKGTGLGLSMVYGFMKQSGGHINVYSEVGIGTTFRLYLPRAEAGAREPAAAAPEPLSQGRGETVLAVEDNAGLRRVVVRQLTELGYRVIEAQDGQDALKVLDSERVDLLFSDIVMPGGTSGYELARTAQSRWPHIKVVLTSGFPEAKVNGDAKPHNIRLLGKPYRRGDLGRIIREVLEEEAAPEAASGC